MHKHGVVHRDLKPENIMVGEGDSIKLIDFGIAMKEDARRLTFANLSPPWARRTISRRNR